jgi:hypothetical protein
VFGWEEEAAEERVLEEVELMEGERREMAMDSGISSIISLRE